MTVPLLSTALLYAWKYKAFILMYPSSTSMAACIQSSLAPLARTIAGLAAGFVQMVVLFPMEKFVLLKEKKPAEDEAAQA